LPTRVELEDGPLKFDRAVDFYRGKMPQIVTDLLSRPFTCPKINKPIAVPVTSIFLVREPDGTVS
jgi:hypothetical protein